MGAFLDIPTLLITTAVACLCICIGLFLIWRTVRDEIYILSWSLCYGFGMVTMVLVSCRNHLPTVVATATPGGLLLACFGALWLGYRQFTGRDGRFDRLYAGIGVGIWILFPLTGRYFADANLRTFVNTAIELVYLLAIIHGLVGHYRKAPHSAVGLTIALVVIHAAKLVFGLYYALHGTMDPSAIAMPNTWYFSLGLIESSIFSVFLGLLQLVLIGQRSQQRFRVAAETDSLTGLANRRHFLDRILPRLIGADGLGALIIFDIDHFKRVNDTHGHPIGDRALVEFADTLSRTAPPAGIAARIGGEEFALFLPDATAADAAEVADRIRCAIRDLAIATDTGALHMTVSGGVAAVAEFGPDYQALHCAADAALYAAKNAGRDQVVVHRRRPVAVPDPAVPDPDPALADEPAAIAV